jgi:hypothetical protein
MKHFNKLLFVLFLLPLFSLAQSNYKAGYVVTLKGDTLHGFIDYQGWDSNPTTVSFKAAVSDRIPRKLSTADLSYFSITGLDAYQKYTGTVSMDVTDYNHLNSGKDTSFKTATVFLQVLQKGKNVTLYSYTDDIKTRFYIGDAPDFIPAELAYRLYKDFQKGGTTTDNTYQKQLFSLANKYNALDDNLTRELETADYRKPDLLPIVSRINNISKADYEKKYSENTRINFFAGIALNASTTSSPSSSSYSAAGGKSYTSFLPALSLGLNVDPNPNSGKLQIRAELSFTENQFSSSYVLKVSPYVGVKSSFNELGIAFTPQLIYNIYNSDNFKFFLGAGFVISHSSFSNAGFVSQNPATPITDIAANEPYTFNNLNTGFLLKTGIQLNKRVEIFANYYGSMPLTKGGYFAFSNSNKQIGILYFFGK